MPRLGGIDRSLNPPLNPLPPSLSKAPSGVIVNGRLATHFLFQREGFYEVAKSVLKAEHKLKLKKCNGYKSLVEMSPHAIHIQGSTVLYWLAISIYFYAFEPHLAQMAQNKEYTLKK